MVFLLATLSEHRDRSDLSDPYPYFLRRSDLITRSSPRSSLACLGPGAGIGSGASPAAALRAILASQPIAWQRRRANRAGVSPSKVTRCFALDCCTSTGATKARPVVVSRLSSTIRRASISGEPETVNRSCNSVCPDLSMKRMTSAPSPLMAISTVGVRARDWPG